MRTLWLVVRADFKNLITNPMWIFYATAFPLLLVMILGYLTKGLYGTEISSYDYYGVSLMLYSMLCSGMTSSNAFLEQKIKRPNMRILYSVTDESVIYTSKIISSFFFCYGFHLVDFVILCVLFHIRVNHLVVLGLIFAMVELVSVTLGIMMCCLFKTEEIANQILSTVINLICILGGLMFSLDGYGGVIRVLTRISPAKWIMDVVFQVIYDDNLHLVLPFNVGMGAGTVIMLVVCKHSFKREDYIC